METILDSQLIDDKKNNVVFGGFWQRVAAIIIDSLVVGVISFPITLYNITSWKSTVILITSSLIGLAYKPFMEYRYQATLGKMALQLIVVNQYYERANFVEIILRNIFHIIPGIITLIIYYMIFMSPEFKEVHTFIDYSLLLQGSSSRIQLSIGIVYIIDAVFLLSDDKKRSLHDRIGNTYVIKKVTEFSGL